MSTEVALKVPYGVTYSEKDGVKTYSLQAKFISVIKTDAGSIGEAVQNLAKVAAGKAELCMNITEAFDFCKGKGLVRGLPEWINKFIDPKCPVKYGNVGTEERRLFTTNKIAVGIERMVKEARVQLKLIEERKRLIENGGLSSKTLNQSMAKVIGTDAYKTAKRVVSKEERDRNANTFEQHVIDGFLLVKKNGFDITTIGKAICEFYPNLKDKDSGALNGKGVKLQTAVGLAIFASGGKIVAPTVSNEGQAPAKPEDKKDIQEPLLDALKKAVKAGDNVKAAKLAKPKK